jgi:hypothetical protein
MTDHPGHGIGRFFWLPWLVVIAAFNAWMALVVHPNTNAYNGYDVLAWVSGDVLLVVLLVVNACILVTIGDRRNRRSRVPRS